MRLWRYLKETLRQIDLAFDPYGEELECPIGWVYQSPVTGTTFFTTKRNDDWTPVYSVDDIV